MKNKTKNKFELKPKCYCVNDDFVTLKINKANCSIEKPFS